MIVGFVWICGSRRSRVVYTGILSLEVLSDEGRRLVENAWDTKGKRESDESLTGSIIPKLTTARSPRPWDVSDTKGDTKGPLWNDLWNDLLEGIKFSDADFLKMLINLVGDLHQWLVLHLSNPFFQTKAWWFWQNRRGHYMWAMPMITAVARSWWNSGVETSAFWHYQVIQMLRGSLTKVRQCLSMMCGTMPFQRYAKCGNSEIEVDINRSKVCHMGLSLWCWGCSHAGK